MTPSGPRPTPDTAEERDRAFSQALVESLPGVLYLYDRSGRFLKWNPHFERASGYSADEIAGMTPLDFFDPKDHALLTARIGEVFAGGASSVEAELLAKDGTRTPYFFTGQRLHLDGRECLVGVGIDISERVEAERRLGEHVKQLRVLHAATDLLQDDQAPVERILARLIEMAPRALRFPAIAAARVQYGDLSCATERFEQTPWTIGQRFVTADGTGGQLEFAYLQAPDASAERPFSAQENHLLVSLTDMLRLYFDRRHAEESRRLSEERCGVLARATSDAIWDWDLAAGTIWWSEGIETLFGYPADGIPSTVAGWEARIHRDDVGRVVAGLHAAIDGGSESWSEEYRFLRADGVVAHVMDRGKIIRAASGRAIRMIGGISDMTERKLLEAQFLRAQRLESIGTLAGGIAHDLNNVLSPLMMAVSILKMEESPADRVSLLETIETSGRRGSEMVRQVLAFARGIEGQRLPVNVRHVFKDVEKIVRETLPKNIAQTFAAPPDLWYVTADATQIHQVLMNLCVNARDAMPDGGTLRVEAQNLALDEVYSATMAALKPGPHVLVTVADTGTGMSPETQARVFEPFFTTKEVGKGTGLGLSTVLTIVKSHGGVVDLYSEPGLGTTFKVYLPADAEVTASVDAADPVELPRGRGELVLIVDDEDNIRALARKTLERHGYSVIEARHGAEAVALYAQYRQVAVVLTDIAMPVMDGPAAIAALRSMDPRVRIISSSGHTAMEAHGRGAGAAVDHFIAKPYTAESLLRAVHEVLNAGAGGDPGR